MANAAETLASFIVWPHRMYKSLQVSIPASNYQFAPIGVEGHALKQAFGGEPRIAIRMLQAATRSRYRARHGCNSIWIVPNGDVASQPLA